MDLAWASQSVIRSFKAIEGPFTALRDRTAAQRLSSAYRLINVGAAMSSELTVFVVDDDELARKAVSALAESMGVRSAAFASAAEFLEHVDESHLGCVVADVRMLGMSGLQLQQDLQRRGLELPVIIVTGFAKVSLAVKAMQQGAVTMLEKPCDDHQLWDAISKGLRLAQERYARKQKRHELSSRFNDLTGEERRVLEQILEGQPNKAIARRLDVSTRTIESRRQKIFEKTGTNSLAELVRLVVESGLDSDDA
jgi:FixJ family two-component response regulator